MADVNANIGVHIDTSAALAELKNLQRQLATFHQSIAKGSAASALAQKNLQTNLLNSINATGQFTAQMGLVKTSTESFTHALEKNKLGMREYFRYAGGATKTFGRLFRQEFDTIQKTAEDRVKKMQTQYIKMGRDANGAMKAMAITPTTLNMKDLATQTAIAAQKQALFNQLVRQGSTNLLNFGKNTQWAGRQLMVGFTVPLAYLGTVAAKTFMDMEKQAIRFKRVYGDMFTTTEDTAKALKDIELLAQSFTKYGVAVVDTMEMAADAAAMGKTGAELTAQVAQATRLAVLGSVEQQQALETTISLTNAFGVAAEDLTSKIDFLNSVENQTVVSIEDLTIAIPKAGPVIQQLGGDVEDLAFFLTAMKEGGINASEGANALKSGLASLINPSKKASAFLNELGVNINAIVEGNQGNIRETVIDFSQALDTLDPLNRARAIEQLFGKFQFSRLSTLFQNVTKDGTQASRVLELAGASIEELAILSERELKAVEDSIGTNFTAAVEELKLTLAPIGKEFLKAVTPIVRIAGDLLEKFNGLSDGTKKFVVIATTLVGLIGPTLLMTFGLLANGAANIIKLFLALRTGFMKLGGNSKILAEQTSYMTTEQLEAATAATSLNQAHTRLTQSFTAEAAAVRALRQAYVDATIAATKFAMANPGMMAPGTKGIRPGKNNLGQKPRGFAEGTTGLPGPKGAGDIIPILGAPGEAIIPANVAQDPKFKPIIEAMVNGTLQGFEDGTDNLKPFANSPTFKGKVDLSGPSQDVLRSNPGQINRLTAGQSGVPQLSEEQIEAKRQAQLDAIERRKQARLMQSLGYDPSQLTRLAVGQPGVTQLSEEELLSRGQIQNGSVDRNPNNKSELIDAKAEEARKTPRTKSKSQETHVGKGSKRRISKIIAETPDITTTSKKQLETYAALQRMQGLPEEVTAHHKLVFDFDGSMNRLMSTDIQDEGIPAQRFIDEWESRGPGKWAPSKITAEDAKAMDDEFLRVIKKDFEDGKITAVNDNYIADIFEKEIPKNKKVAASSGYATALERYSDITTYNLSTGLSTSPKKAKEILDEAVAKGVIQSYDLTERVSDRRGTIVGSVDVVLPDGSKVNMNRFGGGARQGISRVKGAQPLPEQIENRQTAQTVVKSQAALEEVALRTKSSPVADQTPEQYVKQLTRSSGFSFSPAPGIAGLYEKPDGTKVFVKPVMDYASAIAEQRATEIVRGAHKGLIAPEQTIKTMIDPTDETGQRKLIVLESPYDERFDERKMRRTFTKDEYITQLLASSLRGDKDLKAGNLGGNVVADVGNAGVFTKASGLRDYATDMPSVYEMMQTNVREVPGEFAGKSPFWFSNTTADVARSMTADEFATRMDAEVARTTKDLEKTIKGFNLIDPPASDRSPQANSMRAEKAAYAYMLKRLKDAKGQNWKEIHRLHTSIAVKPDELLQDDVTGELEKPKTKPKPSGVKSTGSSKDTRTTKEPKGKSVVQRPRNYRMRGMADAPEARTSQGIRIIDAEKQFKAEQNSLRRQLERLEKLKVVQAKKELKQQRKQSEMLRNIQRQDFKESLNLKDQQARSDRAKQESDARAMRSQNRMMRMQGVGMAAGMASSAGYMTGNTNIGHALMGISVLATLGPMLANPVMAAAAGLTAVTASIVLLRRTFDKAQDNTMKMTESLGSGNQAIQGLSEFAGKVSAGEIMDRRRSSLLSPYAIQTGKTTFGQSFVKSESGKSMLSSVGQSIKDGGSQAAQGQVLNQMTTAVASGALSPAQARSIVANLATELGDYSFGINVNAKLTEIIGPNGENLEKDPLQVRMKIMKDTRRDLVKQSNILANTAPGALTKTQGNFGIGAKAIAGAGIGTAVGSLAGPIGAAIGAGLGSVIGAGVGFVSQKGDQEKLGRASGATVAMQKMAMEQSQQMQDSLRLEYEQRIANAKAAGDTAKAIRLQGEYEEANGKLLTQNGKLVTNIQNTYKNASGAVRGALETGIDKQITNKYKGTANADIAPLASDMLKDSQLSKESQFTIKMQLASGQMDPMQIVKLMETFGNDKAALTKVMNIVTQFGGAFAGQAISVANLFQDKKGNPLKEQQTTFLANISSKTSAEADQYLKLFAEISRVGNVVDVGVALSFYNDNPEAAAALQATIDKINEQKGKINLEIATTVVGAKEMEILKKDQEYFDKLPPEQQKIYLRSLTTLVNMAGNNKEAVQNWLKANPGKTENDYYVAQTQALTKIGVDNTIPGSGKSGSTGKKERDTTYDDILNTLKRTRDATINAQGGAKELMRILGGKKDLQFFKGIDQQLSKLGANSDFIDFIGGVEKAIQNKLIKVNKKGVVSLTDLGKAAKKAYDEKQLGLFSAKSAQAINEAQKQRAGFVKLKAAGIDSADAVEMLADSTFMVSLAAQKNPKEIRRMVAEWKTMKKEINLTTKMTNPQEYFDQQRQVAEQQLDVEERIARLRYENATKSLDAEINTNNELIDVLQRRLEVDEEIGSRKVDSLNEEIELMQRTISLGIDKQLQDLDDESSKLSEDQAIISNTVDQINKKYDEQEKALSKISQINEEIAQQEKERMSLADAITQGDISAASQAVQEIRARSAGAAGTVAQELLGQVRDREIAGVKGTLTGKTADEISARQYQIDRLNYALTTQRLAEEKKIQAVQEQIYQIEVKRKEIYADITKLEDRNFVLNEQIKKADAILKKELDAIEAQRNKWEQAQLAIDIANTKTDAFQAKLKDANGILGEVSKLWNDLTDKNLKITIQKIEEAISGYTGSGSGSGTSGYNPDSQGGNNTPGTRFDDSPTLKEIEDARKYASPFSTVFGGSAPTFASEVKKPQFVPTITIGGAPAGYVDTKAEAKAAKVASQVAKWRPGGLAMGGMVPKYFAAGGFSRGTDTIPAMLTPGEFVVRKNAVDKFGVNNLNKINDGMSAANSVYNYSVNIDVAGTDASSADIARAVIGQIKYIDSQRIRGQR
jgi:TP901 family phage tail tape measure protein